VLLLRGIAKGESTARLSRELHIDRKHLGELRQQIQTNLYDTLPGELMRHRVSLPMSCIRMPGKKYAASQPG
jgi:hypothetical protein